MIPTAESFKKDWKEEVGGFPPPPKRIAELLKYYEKDKDETTLARYYHVDLFVHTARLLGPRAGHGQSILAALRNAAAKELNASALPSTDLQGIASGTMLPLKSFPVLFSLYETQEPWLKDNVSKLVKRFVKDIHMANTCWGQGDIFIGAVNALKPLQLRRDDLVTWLCTQDLELYAKELTDTSDTRRPGITRKDPADLSGHEYDYLAEFVTSLERDPSVPRNAVHVCYVQKSCRWAGSSRLPGMPGARVKAPFIFIAANKEDNVVLAHELGHVLLNDGKHVSDPRNLMVFGTKRQGIDHRMSPGQLYFARRWEHFSK